MQQTTPYSLVGVIILGVILTRLASIDGDAASLLGGLEGPFFDTAFLNRVIQHHQHGVQLAQTGAQYAQREDVRHFAVEITVTQLKEIDDLETLRTGSFGPAPGPTGGNETAGAGQKTVVPNPPPPVPRMVETSPAVDSPEHRQNRETLARLAAAGSRFDEMFLREMIAHYTAGFDLANLAREKGSAHAVKDLAGVLTRSQSRELAELKRLQTAARR